jgi:two-component system, response regulator / RNA-binding antiterminator
MLRILLVDECPKNAPQRAGLRLALEGLGHTIVAEIAGPQTLWDSVKQHNPDALIIDTESPSRDMLEPLSKISTISPRPVVMFTHDARSDSIRDAVHAGISAYIVDGFAPERVAPILEAALARFEALQSVRAELAQTKSKLSERKLVDRAKGILMKEKKLGEEEAYRLLRKLAMDRSAPMGTVAEQVITYAKLLS